MTLCHLSKFPANFREHESSHRLLCSVLPCPFWSLDYPFLYSCALAHYRECKVPSGRISIWLERVRSSRSQANTAALLLPFCPTASTTILSTDMTGKRRFRVHNWLLYLDVIERARTWAEQDRTVCSPDGAAASNNSHLLRRRSCSNRLLLDKLRL